MRKFAGGIVILHMCTKNPNHMMYGSWDSEWDRQKFFSLWAIFCSFTPPLMISNIKILKKKWKNACRYYPFIYTCIHVYHKWRSYDVWFLKCKVRQTEIFDILGYFLPVQPLDNLENQNFNTEKNTWRHYHFTHLHHKWQSYDIWFLRYGVRQT